MFDMKTSEVAEAKKPEATEYKEIKPENNTSVNEAKNFWNKEFNSMENEALEEATQKYIDDVREKSEYKDTIPEKPFEASDLRKVPIEETAIMREEFVKTKADLIQQWEEKHGCSWPTYKEDVYITNKSGEKVLVREAGMKYDAHHLQALSLGGKNEVSNITPLRADLHYDHRGVHALGSPYDNLNKMVRGIS